ncbi:MAG: methyltransferase type 11 [Gemmatimonadetes bacterium]|nr:methyltransferase type 11 [Gemmatimonadota bacterium]
MKVAIETAFDAIGERAWNDLVRRSTRASVFQSWSWQRAWWRAFHDAAAQPGQLMLVAARSEDGALLALASLFIEKEGNRRTLKFVGDGLADSLDFIVDDSQHGARERVLDQLTQHAEQCDAMSLDALPADSPTVAAVRAWAASSRLSDEWTSRASSPTLPVPAKQSAIAEGFSVAHSADRRVIAAALDAFFVQHIHRWSSRDVQSQFVLRTNREMYRHLITDSSDDSLRLTTLRVGGQRVAYALSVLVDGQLWCETSSDIVEAKRGCEAVLLNVLFALARVRGATSVALARGDELLAGHPSANARGSESVRITKAPRGGVRKRLASSAILSRALALATELRQVAHVARHADSIVEGRKKRSELGASHRDYYDAGSITKVYVRETRLQKPEQLILRELQPQLPNMRVLDVGVGAGRTVPYFGTTALDYRGFDFAPNMVAACRHLTGDIVEPSRITEGDARAMRDVADSSCDLVLISYNAIDDIGGEEDRFKVLAEVKRVAAPGGYFCFSSHNMKSLTPAGASSAMERLKRWRRYRLLRAANPGLAELRHQPRAMIHDVGMDYRFPHYYIAPSAQAQQLADFGFTDVRVFSVNTGEEIVDSTRWDALVDSWVYYLCRVPS